MAQATITATKNIEIATMVITWGDDETISAQFTDPCNGWAKDIKRVATGGWKLTKRVNGADQDTVAKQTRWLNVPMNTPATVIVK